ncbi:MAG: Uma2 family endonuclease [Bryobacteraceae bacterium]
MLMVEETYLPMTLTVPGITDAQFAELCQQYENFRIEYTWQGELIITPPTDPLTGARNSAITGQLWLWARRHGGGIATDSSSGFLLPDGSRLSPDAAWISRERLSARPSCPEFVIELVSPSDRLQRVRAKMLDWIANGTQVGSLIDPPRHAVEMFRPEREPEVPDGGVRARPTAGVGASGAELVPAFPGGLERVPDSTPIQAQRGEAGDDATDGGLKGDAARGGVEIESVIQVVHSFSPVAG